MGGARRVRPPPGSAPAVLLQDVEDYVLLYACVFYTDIACLGGVFAKNTSRETKFSLKTGIFRKYPSQP